MTVEDRLNKLERESKNWRRIALGLALVLGVSLVCSQGTQALTASQAFAAADNETFDTLRARQLHIVSPSGEVVAEFFGHDTGTDLVIRHFDADTQKLSEQTTVRCHVTLLESFDGVEKGKPGLAALAFGVTKQRNDGFIGVYNPNTNTPVVFIGLTEQSNGGFISVYNPFQNVVASMQSNNYNTGMVVVHDVNGKLSNALLPK
jgi:hypothetical protein